VGVIKRILLNLTMVLLFGIAGVMLVPAALGYHRYIILTGSMTGTYDPGSLVFDKPVPTSSLKVGDPITYAPPPGASPNHALVTHRIWRIYPGPGGQRAYRTKGDANPAPDVWKFVLPQSTQDEVKFHLPYVGYVFELLSVRQFRTVLIGIPALGTDVAEHLPKLAPLAEAVAAAGRATVRLAVIWPSPDGAASRTRQLVGFITPLVRPRQRTDDVPRVVTLPPGCHVGPRRTTERRRDALPADWTLVVNPKP
jgi:signal peptidase